jgi:hypothetical protein
LRVTSRGLGDVYKRQVEVVAIEISMAQWVNNL